jgi:hypothetical protein
MIDINKLVAGRRASFIHNATVETVAKRDGVEAPNWLQSSHVTRRGVFSGNIADAASYTNMMTRDDPDYTSSGKQWFSHHPEQAGIVLHNKKGTAYLCVLHPRVQKADYLVNGQPATREQETTIRTFKKNRGHGKFAVYDLEKVQCKGYVEPTDFDGDIED